MIAKSQVSFKVIFLGFSHSMRPRFLSRGVLVSYLNTRTFWSTSTQHLRRPSGHGAGPIRSSTHRVAWSGRLCSSPTAGQLSPWRTTKSEKKSDVSAYSLSYSALNIKPTILSASKWYRGCCCRLRRLKVCGLLQFDVRRCRCGTRVSSLSFF